MIILEDIVKKKIKLTDSEATKVSKFIGKWKQLPSLSLMRTDQGPS